MFGRLAVWLTRKLLENADLSIEQRHLLTGSLLEKLGALPFRDILEVSEDGTILLQGRSLDAEKARVLRDAATTALDNQALRLIREQIAFTAVTFGVHKAETERQLFFSRAALWWGQSEDRFLKLLAQKTEEPDL